MIYLDYQATTPLAPEAREAMMPWLGGPDTMGFANPHSPHRPGRAAAAAVEVAREQVAALLPPGGRVVFTSGATEALNLALAGSGSGSGAGRHCLAVSAIEHAAVLDTARALDPATRILPVNGEGLVDSAVSLGEGTGLVAVMQVNNEIGTVQPVERLAEAAHAAGALFLCDAVQGAGKMAPPADADLIAVSAHKLYGPKGVGALWVRDGLELAPLIHGGGQEQGLRSGTLSPALCAGFGAAAALSMARMEEDAAHVALLWRRAREILGRWTLNGSADQRWQGNLNLRLPGLDVARLMSEVRQVAFSAGSACASGSGRTSYVLKAIGLVDKDAKASIRLGFGRYTELRELEDACAQIDAAAAAQGV
ncbi:cysteine desulfurase family protein [Novosphingobium pentaromativorans]|uniref:Cysteine desulfurase n=1 Tax=Novosphingobium pentaromativorans US6-1 TaxID=1088721 RepID=G6EID1_9SPHN|nr:cysteine desulfurase family protein [Novosphingobium pentaromativorans]AIT78756.1 aminotransferase [Novosphingobium pentaromativorans US6-1]EHJ58873.1 cysteine desulfurase [Novosphingobium pentaromativorans US6-1]